MLMSDSIPSFTLTASAQAHIKDVIEKKGKKGFFRISVSGGGCNGFQYQFSFAQTPQPEDVSLNIEGVPILIDSLSLPFLEGLTLDYKHAMMGSAFQVTNPNASTSCGCGNSFSI